jgi:ribonucleoside-diphosphate reductase beta chain
MRPSIETNDRSYRYYRNAVERHWDPGDIDLEPDVGPVSELDERSLDRLRSTLAQFGAGEEAVTEDLAPLAVVLEDVTDQLFVTTQLYEEAKHADFFDRYWREVINRAERSQGIEETDPTEDRWYAEEYDELFARNERAMARLLEEDTPENRAIAYCHYHLAIEGILAQTGYYGVQSTFDGSAEGLPELSGLVEGFTKIRADEGRHVGFGMNQLRCLVQEDGVSPSLLHETVGELSQLTQGIVASSSDEDGPGLDSSDLVSYAAEKHIERMQQIVEDDETTPDVEQLVALDDS